MNTNIRTAAAYIRVSTDSQTELSPDSQIKVVREYGKNHGFLIPQEYIFRDDGISGRHADKRPAFNEMIATAKQKPSPFSAVLLWKFSRFARNQEESIFYKSMLRKNGVEVISISEPMLDGPFGTLIERIIEWSDEYYSIRLSGEVRRGMTEKVERGGAVSIPAFGYNIVDKKYIINPQTAPFVRKIYADFIGGKPIIQIARELNALRIRTTRGNRWENRTVEYILRNPVYIGKIRWNPKRRTRRDYDDPDVMIVDGQHEPIIKEDVFNAAQELIAANKKKYNRYNRAANGDTYMLHGLVKCSNCGGSLGLSVGRTSLQCVNYTHGRCNVSHSITLKKINEAVLRAIEAAFQDGAFSFVTKDMPQPEEPELDIDALIEREKLKLRRVREAYEDGVYTLDEFRESKQQIELQIDQLSKIQPPEKEPEELRQSIINRSQALLPILRDESASDSEKNKILRSFVNKIVFYRYNESVFVEFYC